MSRTERQRELVETYRAVLQDGLPHVLVGGWAVSAFQTRFTTDIDVVVPEAALPEYRSLLADRGFEQTFDEDVSHVYEGRMVGFEQQVGDNAVTFQTMVDTIRCRQTDAEWSYRYLEKHSRREALEVAPGLEGRIPEPELLFAIKLHSGRRTDARDLVVIAAEADLERVDQHLHRGDEERLARRVTTVHDRVTSEDFEDAFKGVFRQSALPDPNVERVVAHLERVSDEL